MSQSRGGPGSNSSPADSLKGLLFTLPGGAGSDMSGDLDSIVRMRDDASGGGGKRPEDMSPQELHSALWKILTFRDSSGCCFLSSWVGADGCFLLVMKKIEITIGGFPFCVFFVVNIDIYI